MPTTNPLSGASNSGLRRTIRALVSRSLSCGPELEREVNGLRTTVALYASGVAGLSAVAATYRAARGEQRRAECGCCACMEVAS